MLLRLVTIMTPLKTLTQSKIQVGKGFEDPFEFLYEQYRCIIGKSKKCSVILVTEYYRRDSWFV